MSWFKSKDSSKTYLCSKWPVLNLVISPGPTKDRNGVAEGKAHHVQFQNGKFSTSDQTEIGFIEEHEYFKNGVIVDEHIHQAKEIADKKAKLDKEAEALGYRLVKA